MIEAISMAYMKLCSIQFGAFFSFPYLGRHPKKRERRMLSSLSFIQLLKVEIIRIWTNTVILIQSINLVQFLFRQFEIEY
ncbi:hypothetical protein SAMN05444672_16114 [Bacillus sp. OK838]|nr:hypothetical protein SAMN05444672_16114 [Bacillus sp. OK838]